MDAKLQPGQFYGETQKDRRVNGFILTETVYSSNLKTPKHSHQNPYFCAVLQGGYEENLGLHIRTCNPHTVIFHPTGEAHTDRFFSSGGRLLNVELKPRWLERARGHALILDGPANLSRGISAHLTSRLYCEFHTGDTASNLSMEGLVLELLAEASRRAPKDGECRIPAWLFRVDELLHEKLAESLSLASIAREAGVHPVHLARTFRRHHRCTVGEYLRRLRIEAAGRRLAISEEPLVEIALSLGFSDQSHFSRLFKQHTGLTPTRYKKIFQKR